MSPTSPLPPDLELAFRVEGSRVTTLGLGVRQLPELSVAIRDAGDVLPAKALLLAIAAEVVARGRALVPRERLEWGTSFLEVRVGLLELFELDVASGQWRRGAPRLLAEITSGNA